MVSIILTGTYSEICEIITQLEERTDLYIVSISRAYQDRNSTQVRVYVDVKLNDR